MTAEPSPSGPLPAPQASDGGGDGFGAAERRYGRIALSNTTLGTLITMIDSSIVLISLPAIFRGIGLDPLQPANIGFLLWMLMGYSLVLAVVVVSLGRLGDIFGRVRIYNAGFAVFSGASVALALTPGSGSAAAIWLIVWRIVQGIGGAMLMANSAAILTDAFPPSRRGMALGVNQVAALGGSFLGLVIGGLLAEWHWRAVFWVNVPIGVVGTVWAYHSLRDIGRRTKARIDWLGNLAFAIGLTALLLGVTYGIQPYGGHLMGWTRPAVLVALIGGVLVLVAFVFIEQRVPQPMFRLSLFRIRAFWASNLAQLLAAISRGGLQFMLIIWLQGIWLPLHGYDYEVTPLWAGIHMLPMTIGFLLSGPIAGALSDRFGARLFTTGGLLLTAVGFAGLMFLPIVFDYWVFAALLLLTGVASGLFSAPNTAALMNSVPASARGSASGMRSTFMNAGSVLSIGIFFSLMIAGLASSLPRALADGLAAQGVPAEKAAEIGSLPPVGSMFAAFLGYNPIEHLVGEETLRALPPADVATLTGKEFFPGLISDSVDRGLGVVFTTAIVMLIVAALASMLRGGRYVHGDEPATADLATATAPAAPAPPAPRAGGAGVDGAAVSPGGPGSATGAAGGSAQA
ncbi:MAG: MFS transporter [Frankia sp.]|nr:MFS transporter [Frankia sp.]